MTSAALLGILSETLSRAADEAQESENACRRLLGDQSRAKAIPRCEISIAAQPTEIRTNGSRVAIEGQHAAPSTSVHELKFVQPTYEPTILEQRLLSLLSEVEFTPTARVADLAKLSVGTTRNKLEKLAAKQFVVGEGWRGYRRIK